MATLTDFGRQALTKGGQWQASIDVVLDGTVVRSTADGSLTVTSGSVFASSQRAYRRALRNTTIVDHRGDPDLAELLSHRSGATLAPSVRWRGDSVDYPLGVFRPNRIGSTANATGVVHTLNGWDLAWTVDRAGIDTPIKIIEGADAAAAIATIVNTVLATPVEVVSGRTGFGVAPMTWSPGAKPWSEAVAKIAESAGVYAYFDVHGRLAVNAIPTVDTTGAADWTYESELIEASTDSDAEGWGNVVTVNSTAPWLLFPIVATAQDDDPNSPTYYLGPTGKHQVTIDNPVISSQAAADTAARAELERLKGADVSLDWTQVPNPAHEVGDVIDVRRPELGIAHRMVLDEFEIPFLAGPTTAKARMIGQAAA